MGLFVCFECGCVENTNCCHPNKETCDPNFPNLGGMEMDGFDKAFEESAPEFDDRIRSPIQYLCSKCNTGTWHGEWEQTWPTEIELAMAEDLDNKIFTNHPLFKGSYNNEMDTYTVEQFEKDNLIRKKKRKIENDKVIQNVCPESVYDKLRWANSIPFTRDSPKIGRNDKCICGSGKKYKKCCMLKD